MEWAISCQGADKSLCLELRVLAPFWFLSRVLLPMKPSWEVFIDANRRKTVYYKQQSPIHTPSNLINLLNFVNKIYKIVILMEREIETEELEEV